MSVLAYLKRSVPRGRYTQLVLGAGVDPKGRRIVAQAALAELRFFGDVLRGEAHLPHAVEAVRGRQVDIGVIIEPAVDPEIAVVRLEVLGTVLPERTQVKTTDVPEQVQGADISVSARKWPRRAHGSTLPTERGMMMLRRYVVRGGQRSVPR